MEQYRLAALIVSVVLFVLISVHLYFKNKYSYWAKRGIKGPKPVPLFGNIISTMYKNRWQLEKDWTREYGKVFGIYLGSQPRLVVADAEVLRQITIKDFDAWPNHDASLFLNYYQKEFLFYLQDHNWKRTRSLVSSTFTSVKIKRMYKLLDTCADDLLEAFDEARSPRMDPRKRFKHARKMDGSQYVVNLKELFSLYTLDAIATCCYGLKLKREAGATSLEAAASRNEFAKSTLKIFRFKWSRFLACLMMPKWLLKKIDFTLSQPDDFVALETVAKQLLESRRAAAQLSDINKFDDYMQLLIEASSEDKLELSDMDLHENHHAGLTPESLLADQKLLLEQATAEFNNNNEKTDGDKILESKISLTDEEILANVMFLLAAGLDTTASLLSACVYALAFNEEVQDRLYEEICKIADWNEKRTSLKFEYEALTACQYLDATISESLRYATPVIQMDRCSTRDYFIEKYNLAIPKGTKIMLGLYSVMNNEDYWQEPDKFNPDRFMPGQKENIVPGSYCPFGLGPRHCLGMRFSLTESKLALAKLMMYFRFEPAPDTVFPPSSIGTVGLATVPGSIKKPLVRVIRRE